METNIKKRETSTTFDYDGRTFEINSFDPMTGNYILLQLLSCALPFGIGNSIAASVPGSEKLIAKSENSKIMSKSEFIQLQSDILSTIYEKFDSGNKSPVVRDNGTYGIENVTMGMCINLIIASLTFNFKDFFSELPSIEIFVKE